jgi:hypothetical protein
MSRRSTTVLLAAAIALAGAAVASVSRGALHAMELSLDKRIETLSVDGPVELLGTTRGLYLEGYGAVFTAEVNLAQSMNINPFQPTIPKEYVDKLRVRKRERIPVLEKCMRDEMIAMAASLDGVPLNEQIVLGVTLFYRKWEDTSGLPAQIVMRAERQKLLNVQTGQTGREALNSIIRVQEL